MKILVIMDSGDVYFMEYELKELTSDEMGFIVTGVWEFCPGCLAEMMGSPEVYLSTHLVEPERATEIIARNILDIHDIVMT